MLNIGDTVRLKNLPYSYPRATVLDVAGNRVTIRLHEEVTNMGYVPPRREDFEVEDLRLNTPFEYKSKFVQDIEVDINDVEKE